jgi:VWFA-related protein
VLDDLHTDFSRTPRVKAALRQFINQNFGVNDVAAIVYTSGRIDASQDFTNSPRLLLASIDKFAGRKNRSSTLERIDQYNRMAGPARTIKSVADPLEMERGFQARSTMTSIRRLGEFIGNVHGRRKAMIFVSEGIDYDVLDVFNNSQASAVLDETREAIAAATRANMSIYSVDPRGLTGFRRHRRRLRGFPNGADPTLNLGPQAMQDELRLSQDSLRVLADETGGFARSTATTSPTAFTASPRENSTYYVLAYYPANDRRDGRFRKLRVRVKRRLRVSRGGDTFAPRGRAPEVKPASTDPIRCAPRDVLPVRCRVGHADVGAAAPFKGTAPNATVALAIELGPDDFHVSREGRHFQRSPRGVVHGHRRQRQDDSRRPAHGGPQHEARHATRGSSSRLPRGVADGPSAGTLPASRRRGRHREGGQRALPTSKCPTSTKRR